MAEVTLSRDEDGRLIETNEAGRVRVLPPPTGFEVTCDESNNSEEDIENGVIRVDVALHFD